MAVVDDRQDAIEVPQLIGAYGLSKRLCVAPQTIKSPAWLKSTGLRVYKISHGYFFRLDDVEAMLERAAIAAERSIKEKGEAA